MIPGTDEKSETFWKRNAGAPHPARRETECPAHKATLPFGVHQPRSSGALTITLGEHTMHLPRSHALGGVGEAGGLT